MGGDDGGEFLGLKKFSVPGETLHLFLQNFFRDSQYKKTYINACKAYEKEYTPSQFRTALFELRNVVSVKNVAFRNALDKILKKWPPSLT